MRLAVSTILLASAGALFGQTSVETRLEAAATVFSEVMSMSDKAIPQELLDRSQCVVVVPGMLKGAFIVGAKYGKGFLSCRKKTGTGWTGPGAIRVEGGSFGFQIGGSETDVIMLVMNERGAQRLLSSKFTVGGDASVAAGPVGRSATAQTDAYMTAEILSYLAIPRGLRGGSFERRHASPRSGRQPEPLRKGHREQGDHHPGSASTQGRREADLAIQQVLWTQVT